MDEVTRTLDDLKAMIEHGNAARSNDRPGTADTDMRSMVAGSIYKPPHIPFTAGKNSVIDGMLSRPTSGMEYSRRNTELDPIEASPQPSEHLEKIADMLTNSRRASASQLPVIASDQELQEY